MASVMLLQWQDGGSELGVASNIVKKFISVTMYQIISSRGSVV